VFESTAHHTTLGVKGGVHDVNDGVVEHAESTSTGTRALCQSVPSRLQAHICGVRVNRIRPRGVERCVALTFEK